MRHTTGGSNENEEVAIVLLNDAVRGSAIGVTPQPSRRYRAGRTCATAGCTTTLSIYNPRPRCWAHDEPRPVFHRVREATDTGPTVVRIADLQVLLGKTRRHPEPPAEPQPEPFPTPGDPVPQRRAS